MNELLNFFSFTMEYNALTISMMALASLWSLSEIYNEMKGRTYKEFSYKKMLFHGFIVTLYILMPLLAYVMVAALILIGAELLFLIGPMKKAVK